MECYLRRVNLRRVSDPRRAFLLAFRVTGISDDCYRSTMGVIVIGLGTSRSAGENFVCTRERLGVLATSLGALVTSLEAAVSSLCALTTRLGAPATTLGAPRITVEKRGKNIFFGNAAGARLEIIATTHCSMIFKTHVFSLYSHLCIYIATHLHTVYLDWLQAVFDSNSRSV
jgi:hypothetical protein